MSHQHHDPKTVAEFKEALANVKAELHVMKMMLAPLRKRYQDLKKTCPHNIVCNVCHTNEKECAPDREFGHLGAECDICELGSEFDEDLGWFCPDSPDHLCHYFSQEHNQQRCVELLSGQLHPLSLNHKREWETDDQCIFCGNPDERK